MFVTAGVFFPAVMTLMIGGPPQARKRGRPRKVPVLDTHGSTPSKKRSKTSTPAAATQPFDVANNEFHSAAATYDAAGDNMTSKVSASSCTGAVLTTATPASSVSATAPTAASAAENNMPTASAAAPAAAAAAAAAAVAPAAIPVEEQYRQMLCYRHPDIWNRLLHDTEFIAVLEGDATNSDIIRSFLDGLAVTKERGMIYAILGKFTPIPAQAGMVYASEVALQGKWGDKNTRILCGMASPHYPFHHAIVRASTDVSLVQNRLLLTIPIELLERRLPNNGQILLYLRGNYRGCVERLRYSPSLGSVVSCERIKSASSSSSSSHGGHQTDKHVDKSGGHHKNARDDGNGNGNSDGDGDGDDDDNGGDGDKNNTSNNESDDHLANQPPSALEGSDDDLVLDLCLPCVTSMQICVVQRGAQRIQELPVLPPCENLERERIDALGNFITGQLPCAGSIIRSSNVVICVPGSVLMQALSDISGNKPVNEKRVNRAVRFAIQPVPEDSNYNNCIQVTVSSPMHYTSGRSVTTFRAVRVSSPLPSSLSASGATAPSAAVASNDNDDGETTTPLAYFTYMTPEQNEDAGSALPPPEYLRGFQATVLMSAVSSLVTSRNVAYYIGLHWPVNLHGGSARQIPRPVPLPDTMGTCDHGGQVFPAKEFNARTSTVVPLSMFVKITSALAVPPQNDCVKANNDGTAADDDTPIFYRQHGTTITMLLSPCNDNSTCSS